MENLEFLFLQNNQLLTLPDSIGQLKKLKELHIDGNKINSLPNSLSNLIK